MAAKFTPPATSEGNDDSEVVTLNETPTPLDFDPSNFATISATAATIPGTSVLHPYSPAALLAAKLCQAQASIETAFKDKTNDDQGYAYASAEAFFLLAKKALAGAKIAIFPTILRTEFSNGTSKKGSVSTRVQVYLMYSVMDIDTGHFFEIGWQSEAIDYSDKALPKAITAANKTFYRSLLLIPTGEDDPDAASPEGTEIPRDELTDYVLHQDSMYDFRDLCKQLGVDAVTTGAKFVKKGMTLEQLATYGTEALERSLSDRGPAREDRSVEPRNYAVEIRDLLNDLRLPNLSTKAGQELHFEFVETQLAGELPPDYKRPIVFSKLPESVLETFIIVLDNLRGEELEAWWFGYRNAVSI